MYDVEDERGVPISSGIPRIVLWAGIAGVILIFVIAGLVLGTSGQGHLWPWDKTLQIKL
jgi:ABC-type phosphate transport system auxiliary subunit